MEWVEDILMGTKDLAPGRGPRAGVPIQNMALAHNRVSEASFQLKREFKRCGDLNIKASPSP